MEYRECVEGFESIKKHTETGVEYWMARDLMTLLDYADWRNFTAVIEKARTACESAKLKNTNHFVATADMVNIGSGAERERENWYLSRYACHLIAMNADPGKLEVGHAMTYFAIQTRRQELQDKAIAESERVRLRMQVMDNNHRLAGAAKKAGVRRYPLFQDAGYRGLYGMSLGDVKARKGLKQSDDLLDRAGRLELAANDFRITLTEERLNRDSVGTESEAISTHREVGSEVRATMIRRKDVRPEDLPVESSIKPLVQRQRRKLKDAKAY